MTGPPLGPFKVAVRADRSGAGIGRVGTPPLGGGADVAGNNLPTFGPVDRNW